LRYFVLRIVFFVLLGGLLSGSTCGRAQDSSSSSGEQPSGVTNPAQGPDADSQSLSAEVTAAEAAISASNWKAAEAKLDPWLLSHPNDARALFDAGYVADAQNRLDDAVSLYRRATAANPKSLEAHLSLGLLLARQGKPADARPELIAATKLDPGEAGPDLKARAWRALAQLDRPEPGANNDTTPASNDLLEALKLSPETPADTLFAASLAEQAGQIDAAEAAYRRILEKDPKSEPANSGLAHLLIRKKQYPEAETLLRSALEKRPDDPALTAQLAAVLAAQDDAEALPLLQKLHTAHPDDKAITSMLAGVSAVAGDAAGSDQLYLKLLAASPIDSDLLVAHGENLVSLSRFADAFSVFGKATEIDPANGAAWSGLAFTASKTKQPSVALHALTERSKYLPENASTYFLWATSYDTMHDKAQAAVYYHHFLDSSAGRFPDQEWQARQRLQLLERKSGGGGV
jgi:predicted Zn-dependent protease